MSIVIVAGGRTFNDKELLDNVLDHLFTPLGRREPTDCDEIVSGLANGADSLGEQWAGTNWINVKEFPANWEKYGRSAGHIRNAEMADYGDVLVAFWDGASRGTKGMIEVALKRGLTVHVYRY